MQFYGKRRQQSSGTLYHYYDRSSPWRVLRMKYAQNPVSQDQWSSPILVPDFACDIKQTVLCAPVTLLDPSQFA